MKDGLPIMPTVEEMMAWDSWDWHEHDMKPHGNFTRLEKLSQELTAEADQEYQKDRSLPVDGDQ